MRPLVSCLLQSSGTLNLCKKSKCIVHQLNGYYNSLFNANNLTTCRRKVAVHPIKFCLGPLLKSKSLVPTHSDWFILCSLIKQGNWFLLIFLLLSGWISTYNWEDQNKILLYLYIKTIASQIITTYEKNVITKIRCTKVYVGILYFTAVEIKNTAVKL